MFGILLAVALPLNGSWRLDYWPEPDKGPVRTLGACPKDRRQVPATVPGNCELELVRAGVLPEPEKGMNVLRLRDYEGHQWLYTKTFDAPAVRQDGSCAELVFDGVDTLADYFLNGEKIGESANMFIAHRFDVTDRLRPGSNVVQVLLRSVLLDSRFATTEELGGSRESGPDIEPYRKAAHMGGWDIFPRTYASGLWRDVRLEISGPDHIDQTAWIVRDLDVANRRASLMVRARIRAPFSRLDHARVRCSLSRNGNTAAVREIPFVRFHQVILWQVKDVDLWWPAGFGDAALYDAKIELLDESGKALSEHAEKIGIRTIELVRDDVYGADRPGQFLFKVNGEPCYIRGTNWVPLDALHGRDMQHLYGTLALVKDLNCNMIRVWGGSVYESDAFYDWCDANGVMVWQDFMTGCSVFPQDDDYARATAEEVRAVVLRLRNHPSIALWSGNNENDQAFSWVLGQRLGVDPNSDRNSRRTIPEVLRAFDVTRPYLPSSPYLSPDVVAGKARPSEMHLWGVRGYYKVDYYTNAPCWFASEMGYHGCPNRASLERMMTPGCVFPWKGESGFAWNDEWLLKACNAYMLPDALPNPKRNGLMTNQCCIMFGNPSRDLDTFIAQSQFVQAEAMKTFCELFRSRKFVRMNGLIWWNVRDGWPIVSDAVVDYYGGKKPAYAALKNAQQDQIVCVTDDHRVWAVNDVRRAVKGHATLADVATGRKVMNADFTIPANGRIELGRVPFEGQGVILIEATLDGKAYRNHFLYGEPPFDWNKIKEWGL